MSNYTTVKDLRRLAPEAVTLEMIGAAIEAQEQEVRHAAVALGHATGAVYGLKKSPFPMDDKVVSTPVDESADPEIPPVVKAAIEAQAVFAHELERLSKLVSWKSTKELGL